MAQAQKSDWKTKPLPRKRETIELGLRFSSGEMERIWQGFVPSMMEEKWFIYFADNVLYCHRSWTGYCIYKVYSRAEDAGFSLTHMDVNRNPEQYSETDKVNDRYEIISLLNTYLFRKEPSFTRDGNASSVPPECVRIIPAQHFFGTPAPEHRPYAFYADAPSLEGKTIAECYRLVMGLSLPPRDVPGPRENRTPFLWDASNNEIDSPLTKIKNARKGGICYAEYPEKKLNNLEFVVLRVPGQTARWELDAFPATWRALAYLLSDANRMGWRPNRWDIKPTAYTSARLHSLFCDLLANNDKDRLALMNTREELGLHDFSRHPDPSEEIGYYNYISLNSMFTNEIAALFGTSYRCWHGCGYIGWPGEPLCRLFFLRNRMSESMQVSVMKGKDVFSCIL